MACLAVSFLLTWDLWAVRDSPPMLPLLHLPRVDVRCLLLPSLAATVLRARVGLPVLALVQVYGVVIDQTRIQPEFFSLTLLLMGTTTNTALRFIGAAHLVTMWTWAGIHKLLSPAFLAVTAPAMMTATSSDIPRWMVSSSGYMLACAELMVAVLAMVPRTRIFGAAAALVLHLGIIFVLACQTEPNVAVWPWNAALSLSGFFLIVPMTDGLVQAFRKVPAWSRAIVTILALAPAGYYFGVVDAYLSHNLYTSSTPIASDAPRLMKSFRVPFPPAHRLYEQHFQLTCQPGEMLLIVDRRPWLRRRQHASVEILCLQTLQEQQAPRSQAAPATDPSL